MFEVFIVNVSYTKNLDELEACIMKRINFAVAQKIQIHQYMMRIKKICCCAISELTIHFDVDCFTSTTSNFHLIYILCSLKTFCSLSVQP